MSDSRVTIPLATFAQTMRALNPRYASESDERLLEIVASENPQCRLVMEGANVSLENLQSIFSMDAERKSQQAAPPPVHSGSAFTLLLSFAASSATIAGRIGTGKCLAT